MIAFKFKRERIGFHAPLLALAAWYVKRIVPSEIGAAWKGRRRGCPAGGPTLVERASRRLTEGTPNPDCHATVLQSR